MTADGDPGRRAPMPTEAPVGPSHWLGPDLAPADWVRPLDDREVADLISFAEDCDLDRAGLLAQPVSGEVPPSLTALAGEVERQLLDGLGFSVLTGFPVDDLPARQTAACYLTLGRLLGGLRSQNAAGHLLGHVRNVGADPDKPTTRIYQTDRRQTFHTDSADVVGLLCLTPARHGGESLLVSAEAVYRLLHERSPAHAARLFEPVATDRRGEVPPGEQPWFEIPVLNWFEGCLTALYQRQYIDSAHRFPDAPTPDDHYIEALDLFDSILDDPAVHLSVPFSPGDVQFVNNHALLHDRTEFVDEPGSPRHLLRLWLTVPGGRPLPSVFTQRYGSVTVGDRGGILTAGTALTVPI